MIELIDTHTHLFVEEFDEDRDAAVVRALEAGVGHLCLPCIDISSVESIDAMCKRYPGVCHSMIGLHPTDVKDDYKEQLAQMYNLLDCNDDYIAIGEVGLDFYWDRTYEQQQVEAFEKQIEWAIERRLPLVIHSRNSFDRLYSIMYSHRSDELTGIFHCFSGNVDEASALLEFPGFMLGVGGVLTYKKSTLPQVLATAVPLERIVLETDSPYLAPVPYRGRRNESSYVVEVAKFLANLYNTSFETVAAITTANARKIFTRI